MHYAPDDPGGRPYPRWRGRPADAHIPNDIHVTVIRDADGTQILVDTDAGVVVSVLVEGPAAR